MSNRALSHYRFSKAFAWLNRHIRSRRKIIKKVRALYQKYGLEKNGCVLCQNDEFSLISEGDRYGFDLNKQICNHCGLVQTYPSTSALFHQEFYSFYYRPLYLKNKEVNYHALVKEQIDKANLYFAYFTSNRLEKEILKGLSIVEIGCSSGGTLNTLKPFVKSVYGCDLDIKAIEFARRNFDINVEVSMYPKEIPEGCKLFIMSHVLEHVHNPLETLKKIRTMMTPDDYLFIAVPGLNMVAKGFYKNDLRRYFHIAHVSDFTSSTLINLAGCAGFEVLNIDEEINALFIPSQEKTWKKHNGDSVENIKLIEQTYRGLPPHL